MEPHWSTRLMQLENKLFKYTVVSKAILESPCECGIDPTDSISPGHTYINIFLCGN